MYRGFREALDGAIGRSESAIIIFVDVRGFTDFSKSKDSHDTALYIKRVYIQLIDKYFPSATFYKPTGDGLLIVIPLMSHDYKTLPDKCKEVIESCLRCHAEFADICKGDHMINFAVPSRVGIGVVRGSACCLMSGGAIIDYSGHNLNLASRLMNIARPSGIVIDGAFGFDLLSEDQQKLFEGAKVYLRSIAEDTPINVYILKDVVRIPPENLQPLAEERWEVIEEKYTARQWRDRAKWYRVNLEAPLKRSEGALDVCFIYPARIRGKMSTSVKVTHPFSAIEYKVKAGQAYVRININELMRYLKSHYIPLDTKVKMRLAYVPKPK